MTTNTIVIKMCICCNKNIISLAVISLLIFIPLYPKFPLFNIPGTYVAGRIVLASMIIVAQFLDQVKKKVTKKAPVKRRKAVKRKRR